jgi:hypothetical protein
MLAKSVLSAAKAAVELNKNTADNKAEVINFFISSSLSLMLSNNIT